MSTVGSYTYNFGKQYNIYCSDLSVSYLRNYKKETLPQNAIIISSPIEGKKQKDTGKPAIVITDNFSYILPLTYTHNNEHFIIDESTNSVFINISYIQDQLYTYIQDKLYTYFSNIFVKK